MTSKKGTKRQRDKQFKRCVRTHKVEESVRGASTSRHISHLKKTVNTKLNPIPLPEWDYPPLASRPHLKIPSTPGESPDQANEEDGVGKPDERTQV
jgi:hypothetical protein